MIVETIGLGMLMSLFLTETIGLAAGGIVVPGYIALFLTQPLRVLVTVLIAVITFLLTKLLSNFMLLFGRRLLVITILLGYLIGFVFRVFPPIYFQELKLDLTTIGYVIPGLIAYWMFRQGIVETLTTMTIAAILTRLLIIIISNGSITVI
ncbi:MAG: poly-gamma-glutamate biosynthesis protein PgsC [candidate division WOR-3 bacterium]|nr:poly-gamma-glutamate biosynthesis protein PgsC [candidate division WOR-3 bacterium]MCX7757121.1 poly-gamma-glutamate biosynthesis protein PgsC [candidate division WOR-3 bacterium]MDW7988002.1 poly-gamma-glutamate biosynthesis protein PgsC [candidate division WOR-3 bacterium]